MSTKDNARESNRDGFRSKEPPKGSAYDGAVRLLGMREHSRFELQQKLNARGFDPSDIESALDRLIEQKYLDDQRFAEILSRQYSNLGRRGLTEQMKKRGISKDIWEPLVLQIDSREEFDRALNAARRKTHLVPDDWDQREKWRRRTASFLQRRGFNQSVVMAVLARLIEESDSEERDEQVW
ncbi:regulatory protein RecX [Actinomycetaceae bacterium MB13-C1-2]|nr:regulatory protein RecX [Actinomycetaceae bacterium MB13-C1-2]